MKKSVLFIILLFAVGMTAQAQKFALIDMEYILKNIPAYERAKVSYVRVLHGYTFSFPPYRFSFFRASMGLSFFTLLIEYIMVANTTINTLSTAMPMTAHGRWKEVS